MDAELIAIGGDLLGTRFPLGASEVRAGRAPHAEIQLPDLAAAWEHCVVRPAGGGHSVIDGRSGTGTFVNGRRISECRLQPGDRIAVGETILLYWRSGGESGRALLQACSLLFLFRALASTENEGYRETIETQLLELMAEMIPCEGCAVMLGSSADDIRAAAPPAIAALAVEALAGGSAIGAHALAAGVWVRGTPAGVIAAWFAPDSSMDPHARADALGAIAALAAAALESEHDLDRLRSENELLRERVDASESGIAGECVAIKKLLGNVARLAPLETGVLILGESGSGKELVARALHRLSLRATHPFVAINCAALTETLLESELFGHEKGAFTGAFAQKKGKLEVAGAGTVFLDEIGEMAPGLQAKLLRVLQEREFERVGGTRTIRLEARIIAATNRDLASEVRRGAFREDLYHRLNVVSLRVPALRERPEDILPLARHFLGRAAARSGRRVEGFSPEAERCLSLYQWPGNVRELENAIERATVLGETEMVQAEDLPEAVIESAPQPVEGLISSVSDAKRRLILATWRECGGDHNRTAARLNVHPNSLRRLIRVLNLRELL
jgi:two-component system, NtrC family, response regulator HydG